MEKTYLKTLEQHYDRWFGEPADAWSVEDIGVSVVMFKNLPEQGLHTYVTVGLGAHQLSLEQGSLRQELLLTCRSEYASWSLQKHLFGAANLALSSLRAFMRGDAIDVGRLHPEHRRCQLTGFTFVDPARFEADLVDQKLRPPLLLVEMIAITPSEHQLIEKQGVDALLDLFSDGKLDELNLLRQ